MRACHCANERCRTSFAVARSNRETRFTARLYVGRKADRRSGGGADATRAASAKVISVDQATTACPSSSSPLRPARPVSWRYSPDVRVARPAPPYFVKRSMTTDRAGMLIPRDSVSVANTIFNRPAAKHSSTVSRKTGTSPAWCAATPRSSPSSHSS